MTSDLSISIEDLSHLLSTRAYNSLLYSDIRTLGDLIQKSEAELLLLPNFGRISLREVRSMLDTMGLELARNTSWAIPGPPKTTNNLPDYIVKEIEQVTCKFRDRRIAIETRRYQQKKAKEKRQRQKNTASEQSIATAEKTAIFQERNRIIVLLRDAGQTFRWIGKLLSISPNRVSQIYFVTKRRQERQARLEALQQEQRNEHSNHPPP
jgi:hypothetical protein